MMNLTNEWIGIITVRLVNVAAKINVIVLSTVVTEIIGQLVSCSTSARHYWFVKTEVFASICSYSNSMPNICWIISTHFILIYRETCYYFLIWNSWKGNFDTFDINFLLNKFANCSWWTITTQVFMKVVCPVMIIGSSALRLWEPCWRHNELEIFCQSETTRV